MTGLARRRWWVGAAPLVPLALLLISTATSPADAAVLGHVGVGPTSMARPTNTAAAGHVVTLITGDRVRLVELASGRSTVSILPGPDRDDVGFVRRVSRDAAGRSHVFVIPTDALPAVTRGSLDTRLFDVAGLVQQHLDGADLPLIASFRPIVGARPRPGAPAIRTATDQLASAPGVKIGRGLPAVDGVAVRVRRAEAAKAWPRLMAGLNSQAAPGSAPTAIWLDARERVLDDQSNAQIGVPIAWRAGYTGTGVKVAVLDTGYDAGHPDLAGVVAETRDFTGSPDGMNDDYGHGTHVASIVAGSGAASGGRYRGVAPDAILLVGKVCGGDGYCFDSDILAGMQWAVDAGARVVNLSLGQMDSPGVDPLEQAVNDLTVASGALFVIAAGNDGPASTVSSPASADAALAVASVSRADVVSSFSSPGPRVGDGGMKPDIAAPGEDIVAARAANGVIGDPVDQYYTRLSGTSMATPHVAGAAALLAQAHPSWRATELKAALMSMSEPVVEADVYHQGNGRLDIGRAATQQLYAQTPSVGYGVLPWPQSGRPPQVRLVTFTNGGDTSATVTLSLTMSGPGGAAVPGGMFALSSPSLVVPAHGQASAQLVVTASLAQATGAYAGRIEGRHGTDRVEVAVGVTVEPESYDVSVDVRERSGAFTGDAFIDIVNLDTMTVSPLPPNLNLRGGRVTVRLPKGRYGFSGSVLDRRPDGSGRVNTATAIAVPSLTVDRAGLSLHFDARQGRRQEIVLDRSDAAPLARQVEVQWVEPGPNGPTTVTDGLALIGAGAVFYAAPVAGSPSHFAFGVQATYSSPYGSSAPFTYNIAFGYPGRIPADLRKRVHDQELARVNTTYRGQGVSEWADECPAADYLPDQQTFSGWCAHHNLPGQVVEFYTPAPASRWAQEVLQYAVDSDVDIDGDIMSGWQSWRKGSITAKSWNNGVVGPSLTGQPLGPIGVSRIGDDVTVVVPMWVTNDHGLASVFLSLYATGTTTLTREGVRVGQTDAVGSGFFTVPPASAWYTLSVDGARQPAWSTMSGHVKGVWRFRSGHTEGTQNLPLIVVQTGGQFDELNRGPAGRPFRLDLTAELQPGAPDSPIVGVDLQFSTDDGTTWRNAKVFHDDEGWHAAVPNPPIGAVSLRLAARDRAGDSVQETIIGAYQVS